MVTIGADPEVFCWPGLPWRYRRTGGFRTRFGNFGADGAGFPTGEFRPNPSDDPAEVVENIRQLMVSFARSSFRRFRPAVAMATPFLDGRAIGGHIHVGLPPEFRKYRVRSAISTALDAIAGPIIHLIEPAIWSTLRRVCTKYGRWQDYRAQPHGLEWRFPSFWIAHPQTALGALTLAQVVAEAALMFPATTIDALSRNIERRRSWYLDSSGYALGVGRRLMSIVGLRKEFDTAVDMLLSAPRVPPLANILCYWIEPEIMFDFTELRGRARSEAKARMALLCRQAGAPIGCIYKSSRTAAHNLKVPCEDVTTIPDGIIALGAPEIDAIWPMLESAKPAIDMTVVSPVFLRSANM